MKINSTIYSAQYPALQSNPIQWKEMEVISLNTKKNINKMKF